MKPPCPLEKGHDRSQFDCGKTELNNYIKKFARQTQDRGGAKTYVALDGNQVIACYTLVIGQVEWQDCPDSVRRGLGRYPVPVVVIARLAVDQRFHGKGLGAGLIKDAFLRILQVSDLIGVAAVIVDAKDEEAKTFYLRKDLGFQPMPGSPMRLYLPIKVLTAKSESR